MKNSKRSLSAIIFALFLVLGILTACGENSNDTIIPIPSTEDVPQNTPNTTQTPQNPNTPQDTTQNPQNPDIPQDTPSTPQNPDEPSSDLPTMESIEETATNDVETVVAALTAEYEKIEATVNSYDTYLKNVDLIKAFYANVLTAQQELSLRMREYALAYAQVIISSESDNYDTDDMYDDLDSLYDIFYNDLGDDIYDEIYDGILDDAYNLLYDGVLDDSDAAPSYSEWSDTSSDEYDLWSDCHSDIYDDWSDCQSDIYDFWSDLQGEMFDEDVEQAKIIIDKFQAKINKLKGTDTEPPLIGENIDINLSEATTLKQVAALAEADIEKTLDSLNTEYETLKAGVVSFDTYVKNLDAIEAFYEKVLTTQEALTIRLKRYAAVYAEMILKSGASCNDMYKAMDDISDIFYNDLGDAVNDGFYEGILDIMNDDFYEGVLDDSDEAPSYSDWSNIHSDDYSMWSETLSDCYSDLSDYLSDIYSFWSDISSELWSDDLDGAKEELADFLKNIPSA